MNEQFPNPEDQMMQWITSKWITGPIRVAAELGIPDLLRNKPLRVEELAHKTNTHAPTLYRLLRALAAVGIFSETGERVFELTPLAQCLCTGAMRPLALMFLSDWHDRAWSELAYSVRTGKPGFERAFGKKTFAWMEENSEARSILDQGQGLKAMGFAEAVMGACDFSDFSSICDIGGGQGTFMIRMLADYPQITGTVADLPGAVAAAEKTIAKSGLRDRCRAIPYDFFKEAAPVCDAYFLVNILHDWEDDVCRQILKNISLSMTADSKLWVVEYLIEPGPGFSVAKLLDLEVLVMGGGRERTADEFKNLLSSAGLAVSKVTPTSRGPAVLECIHAPTNL